MRTYTEEELKKILENHQHWIKEDCDGWEGMRADLSGANLYGANLYEADLSEADLSGANLYEADLSEADLSGANLYEADLSEADLSGASLSGADLSGANLYEANLYEASLSGADLSGANLYEANLYGAKGNEVIPIACPDTGSFIGWKRVPGGFIVKLEIPEDAKRSSATTRKCRASKAKVLEIQNQDGSVSSAKEVKSERGGIYRVGEEILPDKWDDNRWKECSYGIHFFVTRGEAERWNV